MLLRWQKNLKFKFFLLASLLKMTEHSDLNSFRIVCATIDVNALNQNLRACEAENWQKTASLN